MTDTTENTTGGEKGVNPVRAAILSLSQARPGETISPEDVAKSISSDKWHKLLRDVKIEAKKLAEAGEIAIYRKGSPVDPGDFKGVWRLGLPGYVKKSKEQD